MIYAALDWIKRRKLYLDPKYFLPISIELTKCATICGNSSTPSLMVVECHRAHGTFGIVRVCHLVVLPMCPLTLVLG